MFLEISDTFNGLTNETPDDITANYLAFFKHLTITLVDVERKFTTQKNLLMDCFYSKI